MFSTRTYEDNMSSIYKPRIASPLSSSPIKYPTSPSATPHTTFPKYKDQCDSIMSSPPDIFSRSATSQTPRAPYTQNVQRTPSRRINLPTMTSHSSPLNGKYSARQKKLNPLSQLRNSSNSEEDRKTRRKLFLNRVKEASKDKRWREREGGFSEMDGEFLRKLWLAEKKRRQEQLRKEALEREIPVEFEDVNECTQEYDDEIAELEDFLQEERRYSSEFNSSPKPSFSLQETNSEAQSLNGSDDDEYDRIFMELIQQGYSALDQSVQQAERQEDHDMVDKGHPGIF
ncbi:hypothetical protein GcM3_024032 [Golovinomyces cichoracearum]|uniref:Uncharacterized protein n=1 Tax=Golovinomyces cichoracearum TaxID=62708 RepID=A0A420J6U5_9PEZI|nr:hypothetical protein GcM3_024032 [Golovinomyces cichoracearum]